MGIIIGVFSGIILSVIAFYIWFRFYKKSIELNKRLDTYEDNTYRILEIHQQEQNRNIEEIHRMFREFDSRLMKIEKYHNNQVTTKQQLNG